MKSVKRDDRQEPVSTYSGEYLWIEGVDIVNGAFDVSGMDFVAYFHSRGDAFDALF